MKNYRAYGMTIRSDLNLDDYLPIITEDTGFDCMLSEARLEAIPDHTQADLVSFVMHEQPCKFWLVNNKGNDEQKAVKWGLTVRQDICCWGDVRNGLLNYHLVDEQHKAQLPFWLIHVAFPVHAALSLEGLWLHAAAVEFEGRAVVITGPSQAGKSTLVQALIERGARLVSDDKLRLLIEDGKAYAVPSHPRNRATRARQDLGELQPFADDLLPVACILRLRRCSSAETPTIADIAGIEAFKETHSNKLFDLLPASKKGLSLQAALVNAVRVGRLTLPDDASQLEAAADLILFHHWIKNPA